MGPMLLAMLALLNGCGDGSEGAAGLPMVTLGMANATLPPVDAQPTVAARTSATLRKTTAMSGSGAPMMLGVQTHFSQGWPTSVLPLADQAGVTLLRDSLAWSTGEATKGTYTLNGTTAQALSLACAQGKKLILTIVPRNPAYDGGLFVYSDEGRAAYAAYLSALADKFGACLTAVEMGNEINGNKVLAYPTGTNAAATYVKMAQVVKAKVGGRFTVLAGSTNQVGTGFLTPFFAAGLLQTVDGLTVHPYRLRAEGIDLEIDRLNAVMDSFGKRVPIWATEFSIDTPDRAFAAGELVKEATLMAASGVAAASWYALVDQKYFPNMGLYNNGLPKDQAKAATMMQKVLAMGQPQRIDMGDPLVFAYRFGADTTVIWGAPRSLSVSGGTVRDATGLPAAGTTLDERPLVISGTTAISVGQSDWVADTLMGWGSAQWRYFARTGTTTLKENALPMFDDAFTGYFGDRWYRPLRINNTTAAVAGTGTSPTKAMWRYTAPEAQSLDLRACFSKTLNGDGVDLTVMKNGKPLWTGILTTSLTPGPLPVDLMAGDRLDIVAGPNLTTGGDAFVYRAVLFRRGASTAVTCFK